jgi:hypothetical protein
VFQPLKSYPLFENSVASGTVEEVPFVRIVEDFDPLPPLASKLR